MADRYLLESGAPDGYQLEDGTGVYLKETGIIYARSSTSGSVTSGTSHVVTKPSGTASGDVLVVAFYSDDIFENITAPAGWTLVSSVVVTTGDLIVYRRVADGTEGASFTFTSLNAVESAHVCVAYIGVDNTTPLDVAAIATSGAASSWSATGVTTVTADALLFIVSAVDAASVTETSSLVAEVLEIRAANGKAVEVDDGQLPATGATGTVSMGQAGSSNFGSIVFALRPAVSGVTGTAILTGGGVVVPAFTGDHSPIAVLTGGGMVLPMVTKDVGAPAVFTGGGVLVPVITGDRSSAAQVMTGGGIVVAVGSASEDHSGVAVLTGGGVLVSAATKAAESVAVATGGGVIQFVSMHEGGAPAAFTGGGVLLVGGSSARDNATMATGGGVLVLAATGDRNQLAAMTGGGVLVGVQTTDRSATVAATGGGIVVAVAGGSEAHSGVAVLTGGGSTVSVVNTARDAFVVATGAGVAALAGEKGAGAPLVVTGGGALVLQSAVDRISSATATGGGILVMTAVSSRTAAVILTGGGSVVAFVPPGLTQMLEPRGLGAVDDPGFMLEWGTVDIGVPGRLLEE